MDKLKRDETNLHIYRRSMYSRLVDYLLVGIIFIFIAGISLLAYYLHPIFAMSIACFACWSIVLLSFAFAREDAKTRIIFSSEGIMVCTNPRRYSSTWASLHNLDIITMPREIHIGIRSTTPILVQENKGLLAALARLFPTGIEDDEYFLPLSPVIQISTKRTALWDSDRVIDFVAFAKTEFGRDLIHYAPHLFENEKEKAKIHETQKN